jgi:hypothetical protein
MRHAPGRKEFISGMFPDQFIRKSGIAGEQHASRGDQQTSPRRLLWRYRVCILLVLTLFGLHLLATGAGVGKGTILSLHPVMHLSRRVLLPDPV